MADNYPESSIHCYDCSMGALCIPFSLNPTELNQLDEIIERKKPIQKGDLIFKDGDSLKALYAIRAGTVKSYTLTPKGEEQITGFHLAGDVIGFDGIRHKIHQGSARALETAMVCEIPYHTLDNLSGYMPRLRKQINNLMSNEIMTSKKMILLLNKKNSKERLAAFLIGLAERFGSRGFSPREFHLSMSRGDIGNYLGLSVETISRLFGIFQNENLIKIKGKHVIILDFQGLVAFAGS